MKITIRAIECDSMHDALQSADASGQGEAVLLDGTPMVVPQADLDRLEAAGASFAYLHDCALADGSRRIVTVPVN